MMQSLDLYFPGKKELPYGAYAQIKLVNVFDNKFISPKCVNINQLEFEIDRIHKELEKILQKAKKKFAIKR